MDDYWDYLGATEEALLAAETMRDSVGQGGVTLDGRRFYRLTERGDVDGRPFRITFDAVGGPVVTDEFRYVESIHNPAIIRDLLAALVSEVRRASLAYFCRGCDEIDPPDRHDDWHVVLVDAHDLNDPHENGCTNCPIQVQEQCGPVVQIGDVDNFDEHERVLLARSKGHARKAQNPGESAPARGELLHRGCELCG